MESPLSKLCDFRRFGLACLLALTGGIIPAAAQSWPSRHVTLVVPFGPGSGSDTVARIVMARASEVLGQQIIIENVGGAGGIIGVGRVAKAAPDGYQFVLGAVDTFAQSQSLSKAPPYNSMTDFVPVGLAAEQPLVLIVRNSLPVNNLAEFVTYMKANAGKMQFGSAGVGSAPHLACFQLTSTAQAPVAHVPYRGSAPAMQDMIAGTLDFYCPLAVGAIPLIENKSVKALAILTQERSGLLPDLPTAAEQGIIGLDGYYWIGFFMPKGTPEPIVTKLNGALGAALDTQSVKDRLRNVGTTVVAPERRSPAYLQSFVDSEIKKWAATIKSAGVKVD